MQKIISDVYEKLTVIKQIRTRAIHIKEHIILPRVDSSAERKTANTD